MVCCVLVQREKTLVKLSLLYTMLDRLENGTKRCLKESFLIQFRASGANIINFI